MMYQREPELPAKLSQESVQKMWSCGGNKMLEGLSIAEWDRQESSTVPSPVIPSPPSSSQWLHPAGSLRDAGASPLWDGSVCG